MPSFDIHAVPEHMLMLDAAVHDYVLLKMTVSNFYHARYKQ